MKRKKIFFTLLVFLTLVLVIGKVSGGTSISTTSDDEDHDGIDDELEQINYRTIDFQVESNQIEIHSIRSTEDHKDQIEISIKLDEDGLGIQFNYESDYRENSGGSEEGESQLQFSVIFKEIIEYTDMDGNNIYSPSKDQIEQEYELKDFNTPNYTISQLNSDRNLYTFNISTSDGIFRAYLYIAEEFTSINNTILTPTEMKLRVEILNFNYTKNGTRLALYTQLKSENQYEEQDETEDEREDYSENETGIETTSSSAYTGFFSWENTANIDGTTKPVLASNVETDEEYQKIYFNYENGTRIFHDPKIGIEGLLNPEDPWISIIMGVLIGLIVVGTIAISYYELKKSKNVETKTKKSKSADEIIKKSSNKQFLHKILQDEKYLDRNLEEKNITVLPLDFVKTIDDIEWEEDEKEMFIREILSLSPKEIEKIISDIKKQRKMGKGE